MKKIILIIMVISYVASAKFQMDLQAFSAYRTDRGSSPFFNPAFGITYDFRESDLKPTSFFIRAYINPSATDFLSNFFSFMLDDELDHYPPHHFIGGGVRYRHVLTKKWRLDSEIGLFSLTTSQMTDEDSDEETTFTTPIFGLGIVNGRSQEIYRVSYIPYNTIFGTLPSDHYIFSVTKSF